MNAVWHGHITFGLVSIPVGLYSAVESAERLEFRLLHKKDRAPITYKKFCSAEDVEVSNDEIVRGYQVTKNRFAVIEAEELEKVQERVGQAERTIEVLQCVELSSIHPLLFEKPYYLAPDKGGQKAYGVLRQALSETRRVGITRLYLRKRPMLAALIPGQRELSLAALRSFEELRDPGDLSIPTQKTGAAELKLARTLIDQMAEVWDPTAHPDEYRRALEKLLAAKRKKTFAVKGAKEARRPGKVVDFMEALRKSLGTTRGRHRRTA